MQHFKRKISSSRRWLPCIHTQHFFVVLRCVTLSFPISQFWLNAKSFYKRHFHTFWDKMPSRNLQFRIREWRSLSFSAEAVLFLSLWKITTSACTSAPLGTWCTHLRTLNTIRRSGNGCSSSSQNTCPSGWRHVTPQDALCSLEIWGTVLSWICFHELRNARIMVVSELRGETCLEILCKHFTNWWMHISQW